MSSSLFQTTRSKRDAPESTASRDLFPAAAVTKEQKLEKWVRGRGIDYALACTQMTEGDVDAFAEQLALRDPAETKCAVLCFRLMEERGKLWNAPIRYWHHPESDALWKSNKDERGTESADAMCVEEITEADYVRLLAEQKGTGRV